MDASGVKRPEDKRARDETWRNGQRDIDTLQWLAECDYGDSSSDDNTDSK